MALQDVLARIPGLAGYEGQRQINQQRGSADLAQAGGLMNIIGQAQAHQQRQQALQEEAMLKQVVSQAGSPEAAIQALVKLGTPQSIKLAGVLAEATKDIRPKVDDFTLSHGQQRWKGGEMIAQAPTLPEKEPTPPEIIRLQRARDSLPAGSPMRAEIDRRIGVLNKDPSTIIHMPRQPQAPVAIEDTNNPGKAILVAPGDAYGKRPFKAPSISEQNAQRKKQQTVQDLDQAIVELERASKEGGLIDKSTGSGAGALVDIAGNFVGYATKGSQAVGALQPIYDLALKMVPRFEGPQSDKDTQSYKEASGQLANPNVPNKTKKLAAKELVRLMKARRGQFVSKDAVGTEADTPSEPKADPLGIR